MFAFGPTLLKNGNNLFKPQEDMIAQVYSGRAIPYNQCFRPSTPDFWFLKSINSSLLPEETEKVWLWMRACVCITWYTKITEA